MRASRFEPSPAANASPGSGRGASLRVMAAEVQDLSTGRDPRPAGLTENSPADRQVAPADVEFCIRHLLAAPLYVDRGPVEDHLFDEIRPGD